MKVGDYVRTEMNGIDIQLISKIKKMCDEDLIFTTNGYWDKELIIKSSPNIIDLIEVGDILVIKNFVDEACMIFTDIYLIQNETQLLNIKSDLEKNKNKKLYSIVTKEQFESMEYKVKE